jgi:hypothetical protein
MPRILISLATLFVATTAMAQSYSPSGGQTQVPLNTVVEFQPDHASTLAESILRGKGDLLRSQGQFLYLRGQGAIAWEQARQQSIQNHVNEVQAWYGLKELNRQHRFPPRSNRSRSALASTKPNRTPAKLPTVAVDLAGHIDWPDLLMADEYKGSRETLEKLFSRRTSGVSTSNNAALRLAIEKETNQIQAKLVERIREYRPADYVAARKFIDSLRDDTRPNAPVALTIR